MEKRRLYLSTNHPENFVDGVAIKATPTKGDVISFVTNLEGGLTPEYPGIPHNIVLKKMLPYKQMLELFINELHKEFEGEFLKLENLSPCLKEIHRLFGLIIENDTREHQRGRWVKIRDLVILGLYEDIAYRGPLQFAAGKANIDKLKFSSDDKFWFKTREEFKEVS